MGLAVVVILGGCGIKPVFEGIYQNEKEVNGYFIQLAVDSQDNSFVLYINNRQVNAGTYKEEKDNLYAMNGNLQDFEVSLKKDNSFQFLNNKISKGNSIKLKNMGRETINFPIVFGDEKEYEQLLVDDGKEDNIKAEEFLDNCIEYIKNSTFDRRKYINTNIIKIRKAEESDLQFVFLEKGKEAMLDTSDLIYVIGETSGHDFVIIVCDSETKEVLGYIPIK